MSFLSNLKAIAVGGFDNNEAQTAGAAIGTSIGGCITDPVFAAVSNLGIACLIKDLRTPANFAGIGGALAMQLVLGPVGGLCATTAVVVANRCLRGMKHETLGNADLDMSDEVAVRAALASKSKEPQVYPFGKH